MDFFNYRDGKLYAENVDVSDISNTYGTPCYVYSRATIERHWHAFDKALHTRNHLICYAVKANSNLSLLNVLAKLGSGFDIVSGGELERVLRAGGNPHKIVFSGVGKTVAEMRRALEVGILCFNVESQAELLRLNQIAGEMAVQAPVSLRINPDVDAKTHPYISTGLRENKFGIEIDEAIERYQQAADLPHLKITGIDCHIGSQLTDISPFIDALNRILFLLNHLEDLGITVQHIDMGGGLGVRYRNENPPEPSEYAEALNRILGDMPYTIILEPGRAIIANAGILLTKIEYLKHNSHKNFAIVDAAMNDLIRPSLYGAWQNIIPLQQKNQGISRMYDVVGPVCETGDFLGKSRQLNVQEGDVLAVRSAGAYGFSMSSNYNSRPRPPEILVDDDSVHLIRRRETIEDLLSLEEINY